jgi:hypothetical protein
MGTDLFEKIDSVKEDDLPKTFKLLTWVYFLATLHSMHAIFERNIRALGANSCVQHLSAFHTTANQLVLVEARNGEAVPAWRDSEGHNHPFHSMVDPWREAHRIVDTVQSDCIVALGMGGAFILTTFLEQHRDSVLIIIEYNTALCAELFHLKDFSLLLSDKRVLFLLDPSPSTIEQTIIRSYQPMLHGTIQTMPLHTRIALDPPSFQHASAALHQAIDTVAHDYSVQALFGKKWFLNIIRNVRYFPAAPKHIPHVAVAAVCGAGPSLEEQIPVLIEKHADYCIIATDTSFPVLMQAGIQPDAVIAVDAQYISYQHFLGFSPFSIPLFVDLAIAPTVSSCAADIHFFASQHPLCQYFSRRLAIPTVDCSGANVSYAAVSVAEMLGATRIDLYGTDFSYPWGKSYARGTYLSAQYAVQQSRLKPIEHLFSTVLYRSSLQKIKKGNEWYYETKLLKRYRLLLEEKSKRLSAVLNAVPGSGAPIHVTVIPQKRYNSWIEKTNQSGYTVLKQYYSALLDLSDPEVCETLLPVAAALQRENPHNYGQPLLESARSYCLNEIKKLLS